MEPERTYRRLFLDVEGTVVRSGAKISRDMQALLAALPHDIVLVSDANIGQLNYQTDNFPCYMLCQDGGQAYRKGELLWEDTLNAFEIAEIEQHINALPRLSDVPNENDLIENRGSKISYSLYGHHAPDEAKAQVDPDREKRRALLRAYPLISDKVDVAISGSVCLDYYKKGRTKGYNVARLIEHEGWNADECIYFGDEIIPGGNDETVYGVIETQGVRDPEDTYQRLTALAPEGIPIPGK